MTHSTKLFFYSLDVNGLMVRTIDKSFTLCPTSFCSLLMDLRQIEGFEMDSNNEPIIFFTDPTNPAGYNGELWCSFVKTFFISNSIAQIFLDHLFSKEAIRAFENKINALLPESVC